MKTFIKYFYLWKKLTINSFLSVLTSRFSALLFFIGKLLRFAFFAVFIFALFSKTQLIATYTLTQALFFFLTFNLIDTTTQLFFREVYRFRQLVVTGDFDLVLIKPMNALFRALAGGADPLDLFMLIPYIGSLIYVGGLLKNATLVNVGLYIVLVCNALFIAASFHILVLALAILTTEIDHAIMIYRDLTMMGRVPVDIYREPLRSIITFVIPVGIMMTFPVKVFLGLLSPVWVLLSFGLGIIFFVVCLRTWRFALSKYASASS